MYIITLSSHATDVARDYLSGWQDTLHTSQVQKMGGKQIYSSYNINMTPHKLLVIGPDALLHNATVLKAVCKTTLVRDGTGLGRHLHLRDVSRSFPVMDQGQVNSRSFVLAG